MNILLKKIFAFTLYFSFIKSFTAAFELINPAAFYGWLDQHAMKGSYWFAGNEGCAATSSTNGMRYLQNKTSKFLTLL